MVSFVLFKCSSLYRFIFTRNIYVFEAIVSSFMGILCENIARRANAEDGCTGRFFETRYKCRECADPHGMLIFALYVDLNPIKAGEAASPRHGALYVGLPAHCRARAAARTARTEPIGWLGELTLREETLQDETIAFSSRWGRRRSDLGLLPISLENYLRLLDWTARQLRKAPDALRFPRTWKRCWTIWK